MNKIFLLATGASINDITDSQWQHILSYDTMGISWFYKKNIETKYYYTHECDIQPLCVAEKIYSEKWNTKMYLGVREFLGNKYTNIGSSLGVYKNFNNKLNLQLCNFSHWLYSWNGLTWTSKMDQPPINFDLVWSKNFESPLFGFRGTMMVALNLCTILGYDEIVLCGVDLYNGLHFYDDNKSIYNKQFGTDSLKDQHSTNTEYHGIRPVIDCLEWIKPHLNIKVFSKKSLLTNVGFETYKI